MLKAQFRYGALYKMQKWHGRMQLLLLGESQAGCKFDFLPISFMVRKKVILEN